MKLNFLLFLIFVFGLSLSASAQRPPLDCAINEISPPNRSVNISCQISAPPGQKMTMRFIDYFAGISNLSERVYKLKISDATGANVPIEIKGGGLYTIKPPAGNLTISYEMRLARAFDPAQHALVSSLGGETAFLMLGDLLPQICFDAMNCAEALNSVRLRFERPDQESGKLPSKWPIGWEIATVEKRAGDHFEISDPQHAVIFLGRFRQQSLKVGEMELRTLVSGSWGFSDEEIFNLSGAIALEQAAMVGGKESGNFMVVVAPFPQPLTGLRSSAVTIGHTVALLLNPEPRDAARTFAHFRKHLAHEMFHFYLPNAFRIRENFDWFWEGFTRYIALVTLTRLRAITFRDYLDALAEEYQAYAFNPLRTQVSLIEASPEKFADPASYDLVYRKGMLVAALYDLELRWQSNGKFNVTDVMNALYQRYGYEQMKTKREIGNQEILEELERFSGGAKLISDDVQSTKEIKLSKRLKTYGLIIELGTGPSGKLKINAATRLSGKQQALLAQFGR